MGLSMSLKQTQGLMIKMSLPMKTSGELELLSLHKIKNRVYGMKIEESVRSRLVNELMSENEKYRNEMKNNRMCITPYGLDNSVEKTERYLEKVLNEGIKTISIDNPTLGRALKRTLYSRVEDQTGLIKGWFVKNYDNLLYEVDGNIPWPIVMKMRDELGRWALGHYNPFDTPIEDIIDETAREQGIDTNKYSGHEEVWNELKKIVKK